MTFSRTLRKRLLPFLLSGTVLAAGLFGGDSKAQTSPCPSVPVDTSATTYKIKTETQHQLYMSNYKYTLQQATDRAVNNLDGKFNYPERSEKLGFLFFNCAQTDYTASQVPEKALDLWQNMQTLKNSHTIIGKSLADFSVKANVFYGHTGMKGAVGMWSNQTGLVKVTKDDDFSQAFNLLTQGHETIHGIQRSNGLSQNDMSWSLEEFQISLLSREASARVGEYLLALELYKDSIKAPWNELEKEDSVKCRQILLDYNAAQADSTPYAQALAATGKAEFYAQFKNQWWLNAYNNNVLEDYIDRLTKAELTAPSGDKYSLESARMTGYISPTFNFTAGLDSLPSHLFGNNTRMQQAFAYVELARLAATLGAQDSTCLKMLAQLQKDKNPYLGLDMFLVQEKLDRPKNKATPLQVMDDLAAKLMKSRARHQPRP